MIKDQRGSAISDHALLRFMERVVGLPLEEFEALMLERMDQAVPVGPRFLVGPEGETYVVSGEHGTVVTVLNAEQGRQAREEERRALSRSKKKRRGGA